jgi:hypothetical protein
MNRDGRTGAGGDLLQMLTLVGLKLIYDRTARSQLRPSRKLYSGRRPIQYPGRRL